ncbi:FlgN protein [Planctomycetes bacterium MalM25]|nr:FlgN protein [Planctomycetes bacterium MalM25]
MTPTESNSPTEALARLVSQKRRLLEQLAALARRQGELIAEGEIASLMQLLGGKQQLIAGLRVVEQGLDAFRHEDPESRAWPTSAARAACQADAEACNRLLAETLATEQQHEELMTQRRDAIGKQLIQTQSAHAASTAYKPHLRAPRPASAPIATSGAPLSDTLDLTTQD